MPTHPDPWDAWRSYFANKSSALAQEHELFKLNLDIMKQHRELEGLKKRRAETERKSTDESLSEIVRNFHKDQLTTMDNARRRSQDWLAINIAKANQCKTNADIANKQAGDMLAEIWTTTDNEAYEEFRQLLEKAGIQ